MLLGNIKKRIYIAATRNKNKSIPKGGSKVTKRYYSSLKLRPAYVLLNNKVKLFETALKIEVKNNKTKVEEIKKKIIIKLFSAKVTSKVRKGNMKIKLKNKAPRSAGELNKKIKLRRRNYIKEKTKHKLYFKINKMLYFTKPKTLYNAYLRPKLLFFYHLQKNTKNKRLLFKQKPYNYKEKKRSPKQWVFRLNRKLKKMKLNSSKGENSLRFANKTRKSGVSPKLRQFDNIKKTNFIKKIRMQKQKIMKKKHLLLFTLRNKKPQTSVESAYSLKERKVGFKPQLIISSLLKRSPIMSKENLKALRKRINVKLKIQLQKKKNNKKQKWNKPKFKFKKNRGFKPFFDIFGLRLNYKNKQ